MQRTWQVVARQSLETRWLASDRSEENVQRVRFQIALSNLKTPTCAGYMKPWRF